MSVRSPLLGYNHNMKYKGRIYHIQTEDSGESNPHIFTHLFHSGIIIATKKTEYNHLLNEEDYEEKVRKLMQIQHKDMMKNLLGGNFDEKIVAYFGGFSSPEDAEKKSSSVAPLDPLGASFKKSNTPSKSPVPAPVPVPVPAPAPIIPEVSKPKSVPQKKVQGTVIAALPDLPIIPGIPAKKPPVTTTPYDGSIPGNQNTGNLEDEFVPSDTQLDDMDWLEKENSKTESNVPGAHSSAPSPGIVAVPPPDIFGSQGGVVVSRPAIILTGENQSFGSFSNQKPKEDSLIESNSVIDNEDDEFDFIPETDNSRSSQHFYMKESDKSDLEAIDDHINREKRFTGPIKAPPGLFKPDTSKLIPDNIISIDDVDTKVDDIILDFLRQESNYEDDD